MHETLPQKKRGELRGEEEKETGGEGVAGKEGNRKRDPAPVRHTHTTSLHLSKS